MSQLVAIAQTIVEDFSKSVRAAEDAQAQGLEEFLSVLRNAEIARRDKAAEVRTMREEAARAVAESIQIEEKAEKEYRDSILEATNLVAKMRTDLLSDGRSFKALKGGKE